MFKKSLLISAITLSALVSNAFAQDFAELDVIVRKFPASHHGFEMFDFDRKASGVCAGSNPEADNTQATARNAICFTGEGPNDTYVECSGSKSIYEGIKYAFPNQLRYGQFDCSKPERGYINGPDKGDGGKYTVGNNNKGCWSNPVYVTKDMVKQKLDYSQCSAEERAGDTDIERAINGRYCARPEPLYSGDDYCYGGRLDEWYTDDKGGKRINYLMRLGKDPSDNTKFLIQYDYNSKNNWNGYSTQGYFPLDSFALNNLEGFSRSDMQSLDIWCPPSLKYDGGNWSDGDNKKWCGIWADVGGNNYYENGSAIKAVDEGSPVENQYWGGKVPAEKLHVYSFTMAGSGEFKYVQGNGDIFEFIGDDDMWIFIDGELAADLGGTHLAAPAKINMDEYAQNGNRPGWENGSKHAVNFFYAERQTDGSNMKLRMALSDLAPPRFGAPYIIKATTIQETSGSSYTIIYVNSELDLDRFNEIFNSGYYPIIINKSGAHNTEIQAYKITRIEYSGKEGTQFVYTIRGEICNKTGCGSEGGTSRILNSGDSLSFNVITANLIDAGFSDPGGFALPCTADQDCPWYVKSKNNISATTIKWGRNDTSLPSIDFDPIPGNSDPRKPDWDLNTYFSGGGSVGSFSGSDVGSSAGLIPDINYVWNSTTQQMEPVPQGNNEVSGFGTTGTTIPSNKAGELLLTAYPNPTGTVNGMSYEDWENDEDAQRLFGLPGGAISSEQPYGLANPAEGSNGGYAFVKNGFSNESSVSGNIQLAPTRCVSNEGQPGYDEKDPLINCLNFSLVSKQPFSLAVTVYDQLGNFVTQYRETITEQEFRNVVQAPNYIESAQPLPEESDECKLPGDGGLGGDPSIGYGHPDALTTNGYVKANVNIYPFSRDGRRFGNGIYILKIDRVDLPYSGCINSNGAAVKITEPYIRYHADTKIGWMRVDTK